MMTAMFVVIFMEQWSKEKSHMSELIGMIASVVCLLIFGADNFLIPTMVVIVVMLTMLRKYDEKRALKESENELIKDGFKEDAVQ